jgi:hypothetical protein
MAFSLLPDQIRRHTALGSEAVWRVIAVEGKHVVVEAVRVRGLAAGTRHRLLAASVAAMQCLAAETAVGPDTGSADAPDARPSFG